jgi:hypothetical protein
MAKQVRRESGNKHQYSPYITPIRYALWKTWKNAEMDKDKPHTVEKGV